MITEYIVNLGLDAFKDLINENLDQDCLRNNLKDFIERNRISNLQCTPQEEIDFSNLVDYIRGDLLKDVRLRVYGNKTERENARNLIIHKTKAYAHANNRVASQRAINLVEKAVDIIHEFYNRRIPKHLKMVAGEIEDTICKEINNCSNEIINNLHQIKNNIMDSINQSNNQASFFSVEKSISLIDQGNVGQAEKELKNYLNVIGTRHKLYPHYTYALGEDYRFYSKPLNEEALMKYPPKMSCTGNIKIGNQYVDVFDKNIYDYAYRHQLPITFEILTAKKLLGSKVDPIQYEAEKIIGQTKTFMPKQFPSAMPCSLALDNEVYFDYILLRTQEILDDDTIIISNKEQKNCNFLIELNLNPKTLKSNFSIKALTSNNEDILKSVTFIKRMSEGTELSIKVLSLGDMLAKAKYNNYTYNGAFKSIDDELDFYNQIVIIEKYFGKKIVVPNEIYKQDLDKISYLSTLIQKNEYVDSWSTLTVSVPLTGSLKKCIISSDNAPFFITCDENCSIKLFGILLEFSIICRYSPAIYADFERLKQKVDVLDIGDEIKLVYKSQDGSIGKCEERLKSPDL